MSKAVVLLYHSVSDSSLFFTVSPSEFARQMRWLKERSFNVVSLRRLMEMREKNAMPPRTVAITFDDGYEDNFTHAFPVLRECGFPATIFTTTGDIGGEGSERIPLRKLSEAQMKEMEASGLVAMEPHTVSHKKLVHLSDDDARREIGDSRAMLEKLLEKKCEHFAYPSGREDARIRGITRECGFKYAYGVVPGYVTSASDPLALPRNAIDSEVSFAHFMRIARWGRFSKTRLKRVLRL